VVEVSPQQARGLEIDVLVCQRPEELHGLAAEWLGRRPGEVPTVYLEHNAPQGRIADLRHPAAGRPDVTLVHVTHFNRLFWDADGASTRVIEHGIVDPGPRYTGELARAVAVVNDAPRRGRVTGTDLLERLRAAAPLDLFGMGSESLGGADVPQDILHAEMSRRRVYVHPIRWTSLGLSLIEAMHLGMPVVALATTEVVEAVPVDAGVVTNDLEAFDAAIRMLVGDPERARLMGKAGRETALARYGLDRFLTDWDALLAEVAS
jgi:glycosyltransferase involved in cell wall biosynthesis